MTSSSENRPALFSPPKWTNRNLRIVSGETAEYSGGFTVEHGDWIVAGPFAGRDDAKEAKRLLVAGEPLPTYLSSGVGR